MNVNYSLALMSSKPGDKNAPKKYYAKAQTTGTISMDEMAEEIAYATSLTDGDVLNVLRALIHQLTVKLAGGKIVKMENLGTFQLQLSSIGTEDKKDFNAANITAARIQFRPGSTIKAATRSEVLNFKRVARLTEIVSDEQEKENNQNEEEAPDPRV